MLFGGKLSEAVKRSDRDIPKICYQCIEFLTDKGLRETGLFRVAGNKENIDSMRDLYQEEIEVKLEDVHDVAGVFKLYLRMLPEPLIPYEQYSSFIKSANSHQQKDPKRCQDFKELISKIPKENLSLLRYLCQFLKNVASLSDVNKMTTDNLAIVFAPNLIRPQVDTPQSMLTEMPVTISIMGTFITNSEDIFGTKTTTQN